jgi:hypothetical protein
LTGLAVFGVVVLLTVPFALIRRRRERPPAASPAGAKAPKSAPRRPVPTAGIEVIEGRLDRAVGDRTASMPSSEAVAAADPVAASLHGASELAATVNPTDPVDLDVGVPVVLEERVNWFAERSDAAATNDAVVADDTVEQNTATVRMSEPATPAAIGPEPPASQTGTSEPPSDDDHTLTFVELDMLRQDYEAEHTLTQQASEALRNAVADLEATKAALASTSETVTRELPQQPQPEPIERTVGGAGARVRAK